MHLQKTVRAWGNVFAVPLSRKEAEALGIHAGDVVDLEVTRHAVGVDLRNLPGLPLGSDRLDLDEVASQADIDEGS